MMNSFKDSFFKLYANCIPVKGNETILIIDLHKISYLEIDEYIYTLITDFCETMSISQLEKNSSYRDDTIDVLNFLVDNDFGFYVDDVNQYPQINFSYDTPEIINNSIIEIENFDNYDISSLMTQLNDLHCGKVEIWVTEKINIEKLISIVKEFEDSFIRTMQIVINYNFLSKDDFTYLDGYLDDLNKTEIIIYNHIINKTHKNLYFTKEDLSLSNHNTPNYKSIHINLPFYIESLKHNVFLNKKVCIDKEGQIKNFISFEKSYGNINDNILFDIITSADFQKLWFINNDKVNQIKHSALRYCFPILDEPIPVDIGEFYNIPKRDYYPWNIDVE